jgi:hypothetical protein
LATALADQNLAICDITLLRLRALLAQACGDATAYRGDRDHRALATSLGFEGPMAWAERDAMTATGLHPY